MNGEFQSRKDIDKLFHDLYQVDGKTVNVVKFKEKSEYVDEKDNLKTIDEILDSYYDSGFIDKLVERINVLEEEVEKLKGE